MLGRGGSWQTAIVPVILGAEEKAVESANHLRRLGLLVPAIRYPTVARGAARPPHHPFRRPYSGATATPSRGLPCPPIHALNPTTLLFPHSQLCTLHCQLCTSMHPLAKLDHQYVWHPFTQMRDWLKREPILLVEGQGATLRDVRGRKFLDANSSIWTNLHGHNHPKLNAAITRQLRRVAHTSALGFANEPASQLAARLIASAQLPGPRVGPHSGPGKSLLLRQRLHRHGGRPQTRVRIHPAHEEE